MENMQVFKSINETFRNTANQFLEKTALIYKEEKFTFSQLDQLVDKVARNHLNTAPSYESRYFAGTH